jgi:transcriptional regulator with XRE-family HTH domain
MSRDGERHDKGVIAHRLDRLFETCQPNGRPYTLRDVVDGVNKAAGHNLLSVQYLSQLRNGDRTEPSYSRLDAIAKWFGVPVTYFSDDQTFQHADDELRTLNLMRDAGVRDVAFRAAGLSEQSLALVSALLDTVRKAEGLPEDPAPDDSDHARPGQP